MTKSLHDHQADSLKENKTLLLRAFFKLFALEYLMLYLPKSTDFLCFFVLLFHFLLLYYFDIYIVFLLLYFYIVWELGSQVTNFMGVAL